MPIQTHTPRKGHPFFFVDTKHGFMCSFTKAFDDVWFTDNLDSDSPQEGPENHIVLDLVNEVTATQLDPDKTYLATPPADPKSNPSDRKPFRFRGGERFYKPGNYHVSENGVCSVWPFACNFTRTDGGKLIGHNDNCSTPYTITEVANPTH